ncbi:MAG: NAD-dependent epimerase/dehydratase family protein [Desulfuromonadaceae bacterium]|nr:NAD-dependent epimerase/dehydratase family protein [Desulfuromonadaceae bacterium]
MKSLLVTGSSGLIGSEVVTYFHALGFKVHGIDSNQRAVFLGPQGDTRWSRQRLVDSLPNFRHHELDIRDRQGVLALVKYLKPSGIIHTAAQPSHDRAAAIPFDDFDTNAVGTLNLLEAARQHCPESPFIHMSTNKVYGDLPNSIPLVELETRWDYADPAYAIGIPESVSIDQSKHSLFGASKVAADVMVQEYGRYFGMPTCCLRGGCLTGPNHSGLELHGFLSYLIKCNLEGREYTVFGYKGKQVRDNIHSVDVARFIHAFYDSPRCGEVYNIGGGKANSCSILEAFSLTEEFSGEKQVYTYVEQHRIGDHLCYYSDLTKMKSHYPQWNISIDLKQIVAQIVTSWQERLSGENPTAKQQIHNHDIPRMMRYSYA